MKSVGQILREAREGKGLTVAQAAEGTRSKSQVILALEADDYSRFPAPIYTRGFIKLYAEYLGLNAPELISLYQARHAEADKLHRPSSVLKPGSSHPPPSPELAPELDLPPPAPVSEPPPPPPSTETLPPPPAPAREPELPFDRSTPASPAPPPPAPPPPPAMPAAPPQSAPPPPAEPVVPRKKMTMGRPPAGEFDLTAPAGGASSARNRRAASLLAAAQASAGRLPWRKIVPRAAAVVAALLIAWLLLTIIRGCAGRRADVPKSDTASPAFHPVPEPAPLYFPESTPNR